MDRDEIFSELRKRLEEAEKVLIGIGAEWRAETGEEKEARRLAAGRLCELVSGKDYYILTTLEGEDVKALPFEKGHMAAPYDVSCTEEDWDAYTRWLSCTLNRRLVILELGEDFRNPAVIRWPFEKTALLNNKAYLYRIHKKFYQVPDELKGKASAIACHSINFFIQ